MNKGFDNASAFMYIIVPGVGTNVYRRMLEKEREAVYNMMKKATREKYKTKQKLGRRERSGKLENYDGVLLP